MNGKLHINDTVFEVEAKTKAKSISITVDGKEFLVDLTPLETGFEARVGEELLKLEVTPEQRDHLCLSRHTELSIDGQLYGIQFHPQRAVSLSQASLDAVGVQDEGSVTALMPGTIFRMLVEEGQHVQTGEVLLILEAMKMENEIKAPIDGVVEQVVVAEGTSVNKGDLLIQLSPQAPSQ